MPECEDHGVTLEITYEDPGNVMAVLDRRMLVQVRMGPLTHASLDSAADRVLSVLSAQTKSIGALAVVNADAGVMPPDIQAKQKRLLGGMLNRPDASMATVMLGTTVQATAMRATGRVLILGKRNIKHAKDVNEATTWLADRLGDIAAGSIRDAVEALQKKLRTQP